MPDGHAKPIEVLVRQLAENLDIDVVFGKALGVKRFLFAAGVGLAISGAGDR